MSPLHRSHTDLEMQLKNDPGKAIIEGKTAVPFQSLVALILQRNVFKLFKDWGKDPVIVSSELLTAIASAPQDSQENRGHLVLVTLGVGAVVGVLLFSLTQIVLSFFDITLALREQAMISGSICGLAIMVYFLTGMQSKGKSERVTETMEKVASFLK